MAILLQVVQVLIPVVAVFLATEVAKFIPKIDALAPLPKQILVVVEAILFSFVGAKLGLSLPSALQGFDVNIITAILQALAAMGFHTVVVAVKR